MSDAEPSFQFWIRRLDVGDWPYALRFEVNEGKGVLRVARPGVVIDPPARARGFEDSLAGEQLRASRFLHVWDGGRKRQGYVLSKLDDEQLEHLDTDVWHELAVSRDGGFRYLRLAHNDSVIGLSGLEESGSGGGAGRPAPPLSGHGPAGSGFSPPAGVPTAQQGDGADDPVTESGVPLPMFEDDDSRLVGIDERPHPLDGPGGGFHSDPVVDGRLLLPDNIDESTYTVEQEPEDALDDPSGGGVIYGGDTELDLQIEQDDEDVLDAPSADASLLLDNVTDQYSEGGRDGNGQRVDDVTVVKMGARGPAGVGAALRHVSARNRRDVMPVELYSGVDPNSLPPAPSAFEEDPTFLAIDDEDVPPVRVAVPQSSVSLSPRASTGKSDKRAASADADLPLPSNDSTADRDSTPPTWLIRGLRRRLEVNAIEMLELRARIASLEAQLVEANANDGAQEPTPPPVRGRRRNTQG